MWLAALFRSVDAELKLYARSPVEHSLVCSKWQELLDERMNVSYGRDSSTLTCCFKQWVSTGQIRVLLIKNIIGLVLNNEDYEGKVA